MKKETIIAKALGKECGRTEIDMPENLKEAIKVEGSEEGVFNHYIQQKRLAIRATLYPKVASAGSVSKKAVYEKMIAAGIKPDMATTISGYTPEVVKK